MQLFDTHCHLDEEAFSQDVDQVVARAKAEGLLGLATIGTTAASSRAAIELADRFPDVHAVVGIQPNYVAEATGDDWETICRLAERPVVVAIGETGLDHYWDHAPLDLQVEMFRRHMALAREHDLPFVVHCREAETDVLTELEREALQGPLRGIMHSFCGDAATAARCVELGMHISLSGMLTYKKNDALREVAAGVPLERLLVETDAPYLAPVPFRGKRNEPAHVRHTAECLAEVQGLDLEALATATTDNALRLFGLTTDDKSASRAG
ncbi:MAG: TatD family hydrolase [Planctomycetaceae bacterium]